MTQLIKDNQHGTLGRPVNLLTNIYQLNFSKKCIIYQYDLKITGDYPATSRGFCWDLFRKLDLPPYFLYDGRNNIYNNTGTPMRSRKSITVNNRELQVEINGPVSEVRVQDLLSSLQNGQGVIPRDTVNALNLVLAHNLEMNGGFINVRRNYFKLQEGVELEGGLRLWSGISSSIVPTEGWSMVVRVLKTNAVMCSNGELIDFVKDLLELRQRPTQLDARQVSKLKVMLKHLKVTTKHLSYSRKYTIRGLGRSAALIKLDNSPMTVQSFFRSTHNITLNYPNLPCIEVSNGSYIPIELCTMVPNQPYYKTLSDKQKRNMIRAACERPQDKFNSTERVKNTLLQETGTFTGQHYGFTVNSQAKSVKGRVLPTPVIQTDNNPQAGRGASRAQQGGAVSGGEWRIEKVKQSVTPGRVNKVAFICLDRGNNNVPSFVKLLATKAAAMSISFPSHTDIETLRCSEEQLQSHMERIKQKEVKSYVFVVLARDSVYGNVKNCEVLGVPTQCIKSANLNKVVERSDQATLANILLKYNSKLLGVNWTVRVQGLPTNVFATPVLVLGADVTHFKNGENKPSIAAVVGSLDSVMAKFTVKTAAQYPERDRVSDETIHNLKDMVKAILKDYYIASGLERSKPARIIYYRDGVSEGQFENTVLEELDAIQGVCAKTLHKH